MGINLRGVRRSAGLALLVLCLLPALAHAATLPVTSTANSGPGSLRAQIAAAGAGDTISVPAESAHYTVSSEIPITVPLTVQGGGAMGTIIDGGSSTRIFHVTSAVPSGSGVTIAGLTLTGGSTTAVPGGGAVLVDSGTLTVSDATLSGDSATVDIGTGRAAGGGAIYNAGGDTTLTRTTFTNDQATIASAGAGTPCCDGGGALYEQSGSVTVSDSTLNGNTATLNGADTGTGADPCCGGGGAIYENNSSGTVTISGSTLDSDVAVINGGNCCHGGGAIFLDSNSSRADPSLIVTDSHLDHDSTTVTTQLVGQGCCSGGGAVATFGGITASGTTFDDDTATTHNQECCNGGGALNIDSSNTPLTFTHDDFSRDTLNLDGAGDGGSNDTCCNGGGAMQLLVSNPTFSFTDSLMSHDVAHLSGATLSGGGGVYEDTGGGYRGNYVGSTLADNSTDASGPANGDQGGGAIYEYGSGATVDTLTYATVTGNSASAGTGGAVLDIAGTVNAADSILGGNSSPGSANCQATPHSSATTAFTSGGHNIEDANTCGFTGTGDLVNTNPLIGSLQDNGGPLETVPLLTGSPAIDGADQTTCPATDMRGVTRPQPAGGGCDIGAYEAVGPTAGTLPASAIGSASATLNAAVNPENLTTTVHYEYGTTTAYGSATTAQTLSGYGNQDPAGAIGQLTPKTTYHYRIVATNQLGTATGADATFTTSTPAPPGPLPPPKSGPGHVVPFGKVAFVSMGDGVAGVFAGCFGNSCLGRATLTAGKSTVASRRGFGLAANDGSFVHLQLTSAARRSLAANSRHHLSATLMITDTSGHSTRTNLTLIGYSTRPTAGAARVGGATFGGSAFVSGSTAGVFVGCFSFGRCTGTVALGGAKKTVSYSLPAASGGLVSVPLSSSTVRSLSRKGQLRERLSLTDATTRSTQRVTVSLVGYR